MTGRWLAWADPRRPPARPEGAGSLARLILVLPTVPIQPRCVDDYAESAGEEAVERLREAARPLAGARVLHVNTTAFGGGVAELLHTQVPLMNDLGLDTTWVIFEGSDEYFAVTKAVHNALQGAETLLTAEMRDTYMRRARENAESFPGGFDFVFVHDPQPAALLPILEEKGRPPGWWLWRCHIDLSAPYRPVWEYFEPTVNRYDAAIFTAKEYTQPGLTRPKLAFIPPSIDPLSPKNHSMSEESSLEILAHFAIDPGRPIVTQVSRFDPWKDPLGVIDAFRLARKEIEGLQLVMVGSLAHDDPEGMHYLELTNDHRDGDLDIHLLTNLDGVGDTAVNAIQRMSTVVVQKSLREGFGLVVAEGMWKEKPVVGGDVGGIRLQLDDGVTGFLVDSVGACAEQIVRLVGDDDLRARIGRAAKERVRERFLSLREVEDYLRLMASLG